MPEFSRLRWLCRRGMKELDVVLSRYLEQYYVTADSDQQQQFENLLALPDPELYSLLLGRSDTQDPELRRLLLFLRGMSGKDEQG